MGGQRREEVPLNALLKRIARFNTKARRVGGVNRVPFSITVHQHNTRDIVVVGEQQRRYSSLSTIIT